MVRGSRPLTETRTATAAVTVPSGIEVVGGLRAVSAVTSMGYMSPGVRRLAGRASSGTTGKAGPTLSKLRK